MGKLTEVVKNETGAGNGLIEELFIQENGEEMIKLFTEDSEQVVLHFEGEDESFKGYYHCLGENCPACMAKLRSDGYHLLPVYSVTKSKVAILRISASKLPHKLLPAIVRYLKEPKVHEAILTIKRLPQHKYKVDAQSKAEYATLGAEEVAEFVRMMEAKEIDIQSVYPKYSAEELRTITVIKRKLNIQAGKLPDDEVDA